MMKRLLWLGLVACTEHGTGPLQHQRLGSGVMGTPVVADLDGDGRFDIAAIDQTGAVMLCSGADPHACKRSELTGFMLLEAASLADGNPPSLIALASDGTASILDATLAARVTLSFGVMPYVALAAGKLDTGYGIVAAWNHGATLIRDPLGTATPTALDVGDEVVSDLVIADVDASSPNSEIVVGQERANTHTGLRVFAASTPGTHLDTELLLLETSTRLVDLQVGHFGSPTGEDVVALVEPRQVFNVSSVTIVSASSGALVQHPVSTAPEFSVAIGHGQFSGSAREDILTVEFPERSARINERSGPYEFTLGSNAITVSDDPNLTFTRTMRAGDLDGDGIDEVIVGGDNGIEVWPGRPQM